MREVGPSTDLVVASPQAVTVGMRIFVSACAGEPVQLDVLASATLDDVLATVQGMVRLHPRDQLRWLYGGRFLEGALTLASHGIQAGATLHLILAGGAAVLAQLVDMGFPCADAERAAALASGSTPRAVGLLLDGFPSAVLCFQCGFTRGIEGHRWVVPAPAPCTICGRWRNGAYVRTARL